MKRSWGIWQLCGFAITALGGTLLHFLYDWLEKALWIAPFSGVNESTWEHMKLLFVPMFVFSLVQSHFFRERKDFWCIKLRGILLGIAAIPVLFYTYNGVIGASLDWINISIFFFSAAISYIYEVRLFNAKRLLCRQPKIAFGALCAIALAFIAFTFCTPQIGIFRDPLTGGFGLEA